MGLLYRILFILLFLVFAIIPAFSTEDTTAKVFLTNCNNSAFSAITTSGIDSFAFDIFISNINKNDSCNAIGLYLNFDTGIIKIDTIVLNSAIISNIAGMSGHFNDSNALDITLSLNKSAYSNLTGSLDISLFVKKYPSMEAALSNFSVKIATVYCTSAVLSGTTSILWNSAEPRKTTLSQIGINKISRYDSIPITINNYYSELTPQPVNFQNNICTNIQANTIVLNKKNIDDTIYLFLNNRLSDTYSGNSDTRI